MTDIFDLFAAIINQLYSDGLISDDLYQYGLYTLSIIIPLIILVFVLGCTYKFLVSIFDWGGKV